MKISIIAAMDEKRGIGKNNKIPWHLKDDLIKLKRLTKNHIVILGRKTYDSMVFYYNRSGNPMPGKLYIVITHDKAYKPARENATIAQSLEEGLEVANTPHSFPLPQGERARVRVGEEIFIIGGGQIFQQAFPLANKLHLTIVEGDYSCDTFFPDYSEFKKVISEESEEGEGLKYRFLELERV